MCCLFFADNVDQLCRAICDSDMATYHYSHPQQTLTCLRPALMQASARGCYWPATTTSYTFFGLRTHDLHLQKRTPYQLSYQDAKSPNNTTKHRSGAIVTNNITQWQYKYIEDIYFFWGEYEIYFIECDEKISTFHECVARVKMLIFSPHEMEYIWYWPKKRVNFLFILYSAEIQKEKTNFFLGRFSFDLTFAVCLFGIT